jgi:hypothetical protein
MLCYAMVRYITLRYVTLCNFILGVLHSHLETENVKLNLILASVANYCVNRKFSPRLSK